MATAPLSSLIQNMLQDSVDRLKADLSAFQMINLKDVVDVTHNGKDSILVYADVQHKAYIPKKYDGWDVVFHDKSKNNIRIDIDTQIDLGI